ncbi:NADPH-dependent FMN reductase [Heyndrickxia ginsengihumi]|uniref:NADPH-dependent FMN reductase n=1 Tax=Heyndrickxia ginsengihumi TaxID=363870 RepID=A0A0A6VAM4_9BACI|nr:NADPH-dependent FMN reductase [Heyndrickxia ginsengihumi]KHD84553.1 NADPH-dependent FMN reductase [Heyndrickxia ginsengihumi]
MEQIVALVGSIRKDSIHMNLVKHLKERYKDRLNIEILDLKQLPFYDQDIELEPPQSVVAFKKAVKEADGVIIATPEYNWSFSGVLKNALDWLSRVEREMTGKPTMLLGASPGIMGTIRAQLQLRQVLASPGIQARVLPPSQNEVVITQAFEKFDEAGKLIDQSTIEFLDKVIGNFEEFIEE